MAKIINYLILLLCSTFALCPTQKAASDTRSIEADVTIFSETGRGTTVLDDQFVDTMIFDADVPLKSRQDVTPAVLEAALLTN